MTETGPEPTDLPGDVGDVEDPTDDGATAPFPDCDDQDGEGSETAEGEAGGDDTADDA